MGARVTDLLRDDAGRVVGVDYTQHGERRRLCADLVVGSDGRNSKVRQLSSLRATELELQHRHRLDRAAPPRRRPAAVGPRADVRARPQPRRPRAGRRLADRVHDRLGDVRRAARRGRRAAPGAAAPPRAVAGRPRRPADRHQPAHAPADPHHPAGPLERARPAADRRRRARHLAGRRQRHQLRDRRRRRGRQPARRPAQRASPSTRRRSTRPRPRWSGCAGRGSTGSRRSRCGSSGRRRSGSRPAATPRPALPLRLIAAVPGLARWSARRGARALAVPAPDPRILAVYPRHDVAGRREVRRHASRPPNAAITPGRARGSPTSRTRRSSPPGRRAWRRPRTGRRPASRSAAQLLELRRRRAEQAEPVDDLVGHEGRCRGLPGPAVVAVVVALAALDVVGQLRGDHAGVLAVAGDEVGDVVADHPAEPAALVAGVRRRSSSRRTRARPRRS